MLTNRIECVIIYERQGDAGVAQLVEQLICNQQVGGSNPSTSSRLKRGLFKRQPLHMGEFQSGQMGQTVNLLFRLRWFESTLSHQKPSTFCGRFFCCFLKMFWFYNRFRVKKQSYKKRFIRFEKIEHIWLQNLFFLNLKAIYVLFLFYIKSKLYVTIKFWLFYRHIISVFKCTTCYFNYIIKPAYKEKSSS